jgi:hypothetical protein
MSQLSTLASLEEKYGFRYPALYHRLYEDGMLNWGEYDASEADIEASIFPFPTPKAEAQHAKNPPFLWFARDFILFDPAWLERMIDEERTGEYEMTRALQQFGLINFGRDGTGSGYAFWFGGQKGEEVPIAYIDYVNGGLVSVEAKNLQDFMFMQLLGAGIRIYDAEAVQAIMAKIGDDFDEKTPQNLREALRTHAPYLTSRQQEIVREVFNRNPAEQGYDVFYDYTQKGLLTEDEYWEIVEREIAFERPDDFYLIEEDD